MNVDLTRTTFRSTLIAWVAIALSAAGWAEGVAQSPGHTAKAKSVLIGSGRTKEGIRWRIEAKRAGPGASIAVNFETRFRGIASVSPGTSERSCGAIGYHGAPSTSRGVIFEGPITTRVDDVSTHFTSEGHVVPGQTEIRWLSRRQAAALGQDHPFGWFIASAPIDVNDSWHARAVPLSSRKPLGQYALVRETTQPQVTPTFDFACERR